MTYSSREVTSSSHTTIAGRSSGGSELSHIPATHLAGMWGGRVAPT